MDKHGKKYERITFEAHSPVLVLAQPWQGEFKYWANYISGTSNSLKEIIISRNLLSRTSSAKIPFPRDFAVSFSGMIILYVIFLILGGSSGSERL